MIPRIQNQPVVLSAVRAGSPKAFVCCITDTTLFRALRPANQNGDISWLPAAHKTIVPANLWIKSITLYHKIRPDATFFEKLSVTVMKHPGMMKELRDTGNESRYHAADPKAGYP